jgi:hypothetical protein
LILKNHTKNLGTGGLKKFNVVNYRLGVLEIANKVKPVYNSQPWDPPKVAVVHRWSLCRGFSIKIGIKISLAGPSLAVVDRWP